MVQRAAAGPVGAYTLVTEAEAFDEATGVATVRGPLVGHGKGELSGFNDNDGIAHGEAMREPVERPVEFTGLVGRYLMLRPPVPAGYLDAVRALGPEPRARGFTDIW